MYLAKIKMLSLAPKALIKEKSIDKDAIQVKAICVNEPKMPSGISEDRDLKRDDTLNPLCFRSGTGM
jgi:hypothetical protein